MDIYSKGFALQPMHLKLFNGKKIVFFDGLTGKIEYPYVMIKHKDGFEPSLLESMNTFKDIRSIENGRTVIATRINPKAKLLTTGKGINKYKYKRK
ncbi:hypothetical protein LLUC08_1170 [Lactococcus lactis subsp. lactis]|jgi:hypothetical protein|uniref:Uncharacterized protein n=1 Tax=Lactococcus lactis subsp. lactis TaxID=1360 RepID=A0AAC9W8D0_LACLL|nr:hypothetical protein [Lactococcus lactis]ARE13502.1 hypothetical protein LLUC11_1169 [Lactococcus lactis subsp. lactis]ARE15912.1 hypothetical protein LLUC08_1170 [Lactococcus lactis subsp. lactis]